MALYFSPTGMVYACDRTRFPLGSISDSSLAEMWDGARRQTHIGWVSTGDLSNGCWECDQPEGEWTQASTFDDRVDGPLSGYPEYLDFALTNICNLQCVMCDGELSSSIRSQREGRAPLPDRYDDQFFEDLRGFLPYVKEASFKGGEPFMSRKNVRIWDMMLEDQLRPNVIVTTNGTIWNPTVERYVRDLGMSIYVSVDGVSAKTVESIRVGVRHDQLVGNIGRFRSTVRATGGRLTLNFCLMPDNCLELGAFIVAAEEAGDLVSVLPVFFPPDRDMLRLPPSELEALIDQMEADGDRRGLTGTHTLWDSQMARLRAGLAAPATTNGLPVNVAVRRSRPAAEEKHLAPADVLRAWAGGGEPLTLRMHEAVVVTVDAPASVPEILASVPWVGARNDETFLDVVGDVFGTLEDVTIGSAPGPAFDAVATFASGQGAHVLRVIGLEPELRDGVLLQDVLVAMQV